ncbi:transposase [Desulfobacca acetoxidans]|uniref:Transposase IS200-like domain-containing protein n=1 Tax=Desulfobacca acetoxidans (strain ATCC 700848 / DSM 11109 / ASRB2) TaxID=880072 RepID=F2NDH9_DESAR|nr:transposase [Desulfobacca acetoxidans]AEB10255.1 hypothetical protein Desac_2434 [Desulfobacca acetoxidans DSM 11109]
MKQRRSMRVAGYDYSQPGAYFITICIQHRLCLLGDIIEGVMNLNEAGEMVRHAWEDLPLRFPFMTPDISVVMPNHFHCIFLFTGLGRTEPHIPPDNNRFSTSRRGEPHIPPDVMGEHKVRPYNGDLFCCRGESCIRPDEKVRPDGGWPGGTANDSVGRIIQTFKSITTLAYISGVKNRGWPPFSKRFWQRNYYDHVVRDEAALNRIREYVVSNPLRWHLDRENPQPQGQDDFDIWLNQFPRSSMPL